MHLNTNVRGKIEIYFLLWYISHCRLHWQLPNTLTTFLFFFQKCVQSCQHWYACQYSDIYLTIKKSEKLQNMRASEKSPHSGSHQCSKTCKNLEEISVNFWELLRNISHHGFSELVLYEKISVFQKKNRIFTDKRNFQRLREILSPKFIIMIYMCAIFLVCLRLSMSTFHNIKNMNKYFDIFILFFFSVWRRRGSGFRVGFPFHLCPVCRGGRIYLQSCEWTDVRETKIY